jgi:cell division transport system permease protein
MDAQPFIKSAEYISKEQAAKELEEELGENPEIIPGLQPVAGLDRGEAAFGVRQPR